MASVHQVCVRNTPRLQASMLINDLFYIHVDAKLNVKQRDESVCSIEEGGGSRLTHGHRRPHILEFLTAIKCVD